MTSQKDDDVAHRKLLASIRQLDNKKVKKSKLGNNVRIADASIPEEKSRFIDRADDKLRADTLIKSLACKDVNDSKKKSDDIIAHMINTAVTAKKRSKKLDKPLYRQHQLQIERDQAYQEARNDMQKWQEIVVNNRLTEVVTFPLGASDRIIRPTTSDQFSIESQPSMSSLERRTKEILTSSENNLRNLADLTPAEKKLVEAMDANEARAKMSELRKMRILLDHKIAKFKHWKKIKSKKFHRMRNKEKRKQLLKEFEELKNIDPEAAKVRLDELDKGRILERATLRHNPSGRSAFTRVLRTAARNNPAIREALNEQMRKGRELFEKRDMESSSSDDDGDENDKEYMTRKQERINAILEEAEQNCIKTMNEEFLNDINMQEINDMKMRMRENPTSPSESSKPIREVVIGDSDDEDSNSPAKSSSPSNLNEGNRKEEEVKNNTDMEVKKTMATPKPAKNTAPPDVEKQIQSLSRRIDVLDQTIASRCHVKATAKKSKKGIGLRKKSSNNSNKLKTDTESLIDERSAEDAIVDNNAEPAHTTTAIKPTEGKKKKEDKRAPVIDIKHVLESTAASVDDAGVEQEAAIVEAFADDNLIDEFRQHKADLIKDEEPKDIDLTLPGWGDWAGGPNWTPDAPLTASEMSKRKKAGLLIEAPKKERKDQYMPGVIISEKKDTVIKKHQTSSLPFPYQSVADLEAVMQQPIGPEWLPTQAHAALITPTVRTVKGKIIHPMNKHNALAKHAVCRVCMR